MPATNIPSILQVTPDPAPGRDAHQEAAAALRFWEALEYLTPQPPPDVKVDDSVWEVRTDAELPWNDPRKQAILTRQHGPDWRFQLFAGIVDGTCYVEQARAALGAGPIDMEEQPPPKAAACVVIGTNGAGIVTGQVLVSSLPWAMYCVEQGSGNDAPLRFSGFFGLGGLEERMRNAVAGLMVERKLLAPPPAPGAPKPEGPLDPSLRPLTMEDVSAIVEFVFDAGGWRPARQMTWRVRGSKAPREDEKVPPDDPLNSFYAEDLARIGARHAAEDMGSGLRAYLAGEDGTERIDLDQDIGALAVGVAPARLPPACWPGKHPLVLAQQFAVNTLVRELADGAGLFAVNGPPGTGKTTMLKDIVAAVVVRRADVLVTFDYPVKAFGDDAGIEDYGYKAWQLDPRLRGFGIVVASANNGAVENITKELPGVKEISDEVALDYFSSVADSVAAPPKAKLRGPRRERWGLIAAVLGSKTRRREFVNPFWFVGMSPASSPDDVALAAHPLRLRSLPSLFKNPNGPENWQPDHGAMPWQAARERYRAARQRVDALTAEAATLADTIDSFRLARQARSAAAGEIVALSALAASRQREVDAAAVAVIEAEQRIALVARRDGASAAHATAKATLARLREEHERHLRHPPGFLAQLFRTQRSQRWNARDATFEEQLREAGTRCDEAAAALALLQAGAARVAALRLSQAPLAAACAQAGAAARQAGLTDRDSSDSVAAAACDSLRAAHRALAARRDAIEAVEAVAARVRALDETLAALRASIAGAGLPAEILATWQLAELDRAALHAAAPCFMPALFAARRELFVAAMALQQAFVAGAWSKLKPTLAAFMNVLTGGVQPGSVPGGVAALWDTFFLVVPVVSTTFASFPRVFAGIGREELGWLLIDEAGQAAPQQAVGAIWRSRRSVIVGDPLQLEPVVALPEELVTPLLARTGAERQWVPPATSAQTLADRANRYGTWLRQGEKDDPVWLGAPLVVHRRCLDPMFGIANRIAYDDRMVYGAGKDSAPGPESGIGESCWIDMPASDAQGHWVPSQGHMALELVKRLTAQGLRDEENRFRVYVITPFRHVARQIKALLHEKLGKDTEGMAGTVHTFQGKEAEHVIFLLGGDPTRPGVIGSYAGKKPNLVNVAVTRARRRLYVIGDRGFWTDPGHDPRGIYRRLAAPLPTCRPDELRARLDVPPGE